MTQNDKRRREQPMSEAERELRQEAEDVLNEGEGVSDPTRDFHMERLKSSNTGDVTDPALEYERERGEFEGEEDESEEGLQADES